MCEAQNTKASRFEMMWGVGKARFKTRGWKLRLGWSDFPYRAPSVIKKTTPNTILPRITTAYLCSTSSSADVCWYVDSSTHMHEYRAQKLLICLLSSF
jgi:hypothetical protein